MRKSVFFLAALLAGFTAAAQGVSRNVSLYGQFNPNTGRASGSWGWTSPQGKEYALLGGQTGTHIVSIDDSTAIQEKDFVPGPPSNWREITVTGHHAYVVSEGQGAGAGMQVIDLSFLPDSVHLVTTYTTTFDRAHMVTSDASGNPDFVYVSGTYTSTGVHILNVSNSAAPVQVGLYAPRYVHDTHVRGNRMYVSSIYQGLLEIVDITNKATPVLISTLSYPSPFTHSAYTTPDSRYLIVTDEIDGLPARFWDITNPGSPVELAQYTADAQTLVHNPYIKGDYVYFAHNAAGLRVVDISKRNVPVEVGHFDTYLQAGGGNNGLWSVYPYFPSGKVIGANRDTGLYIWRFNNTEAGRFYGLVTDSVTGQPLANAQVTVTGTGRSTKTGLDGTFRFGEVPNDTTGYILQVSASGYAPRTLPNVSLLPNDSLWFSVQLMPMLSRPETVGSCRQCRRILIPPAARPCSISVS